MIELSGLTKFYGQNRAVYNLSCQIVQGEIAGFLGLNGAGKSTALRMLAGYLLPTAGSLVIDGVDVVAEPEKVRARIGFLPEDPPLYNEMHVGDYLSYLGRLRGMSKATLRERLPKVMEKTALSDHKDHPIGTLSMGYRKRLGIAQAIIHEPILVILDEPISGLDPVQIVQMRELIKSLKGEHTVLISSHILPEVHETCDQVLVLRDGELVFKGTEEELYRRVHRSQAIEITIRGDAETAKKCLSGHKAVKSVELLKKGDRIATFTLTLHNDDIESVAATLVQKGFGLRKLHAAIGQLEAAFLAVTGIEEGNA